MTAPRDGFTLVEVVVALALFGLIAVAGLGLVDGVLGTQARTDGRVERLGDLQRAMLVMTLDFEQASAAPVLLGGNALAFRRRGSAPGEPSFAVRYELANRELRRVLGGGRTQRLVANASALRWRFYAPGIGWLPTWPPPGEPDDLWPRAVVIEVDVAAPLGGPAGALRRVVELPAQP